MEGYLTGTLKAERLVAVVAGEYYRQARDGGRETLQPLIEVIERAAPGVVELAKTDGGSGFEVRLAERRFPKEYEPQLRAAVEQVLQGAGSGERSVPPTVAAPGLLSRFISAVKRLFSAST